MCRHMCLQGIMSGETLFTFLTYVSLGYQIEKKPPHIAGARLMLLPTVCPPVFLQVTRFCEALLTLLTSKRLLLTVCPKVCLQIWRNSSDISDMHIIHYVYENVYSGDQVVQTFVHIVALLVVLFKTGLKWREVFALITTMFDICLLSVHINYFLQSH